MPSRSDPKPTSTGSKSDPLAPWEDPGARPPSRVRVIDDEPLVCRALQRILSPRHEVRVVELCDLMMPWLTGMDLHGRVAARDPRLSERFMLLTGGIFTKRAQEFLRRAPNERVERPFDPAALRGLIARVLSGARKPA